jgi:hypothetical protein
MTKSLKLQRYNLPIQLLHHRSPSISIQIQYPNLLIKHKLIGHLIIHAPAKDYHFISIDDCSSVAGFRKGDLAVDFWGASGFRGNVPDEYRVEVDLVFVSSTEDDELLFVVDCGGAHVLEIVLVDYLGCSGFYFCDWWWGRFC